MNIKHHSIVILLCLMGAFPVFGIETKTEKEIPKEVIGGGLLRIEEIRRYRFDPRHKTLHFFIEGDRNGAKISLLAHFSRTKSDPSHLSLKVRNGKQLTDYKIDLGSDFSKDLSKRISQIPAKKKEDYKRREYVVRMKALQRLLEGTYSWKEDAYKGDIGKSATAVESKSEGKEKPKPESEGASQ
jgi:hypothetical protein